MSHQNNIKDWKVELVDTKHYAIFHKTINLEWVDEASGENLCFETAREGILAIQYLKLREGQGRYDFRLKLHKAVKA